ncbi:hypothetical protein JTB14_027439 [Gonioctena quinquepunctata]|nr:hypothetical protein JTB14_027439 [Gonioctena quinquepunctata]
MVRICTDATRDHGAPLCVCAYDHACDRACGHACVYGHACGHASHHACDRACAYAHVCACGHDRVMAMLMFMFVDSTCFFSWPRDELGLSCRRCGKELNGEIEALQKENIELKKSVKILKERVLINERKQKIYNLIVYGIQEEEDEVRDIENFIDIINNRCGVEFKFHDLRDWYRIGKLWQNTGRPRPIVVELIFYKQRESILEKASKLKGSGIYISKDYIREDYNSRKILFAHLKTARNNDPEAEIWKNKLIVHGTSYTVEQLENYPDEIPQ